MTQAITWSRRVLAPVVVVILVAVVVVNWDDSLSLAPNFGLRMVVAVVVGLGGLLLAGLVWSSVARVKAQDGLAFFGSTLPLRHIPLGGLAQILGLSGLSAAVTAGKRNSFTAAPIFLVVIGGGAAIIATPVLLDSEVAGWIKVVVGGAVLVTLATAVGGARLLNLLPERLRPSDQPDHFVTATLLGVGSALGTALAFAFLFPAGGSTVHVASAFAASWLCGFVFVFTPGGLGVRESVLVLMFPEVDASVVIATALAHRFTTLIAELVIFVIAWRLSSRWTTAAERSG